MDKILIEELEVYYRVGVPDEERSKPQRLLLSVEMTVDLRRAGATDDLRDTINYFDVVESLKSLGKGREWKLIESVASEIAGMIQVAYPVTNVRVEVRKFIIPEARYVAVSIER
ncbi:MAG: dihydroneopterin aldolase [Verrucomicrobia bacterium]|nr:dihydroneopterin aldolase [Verrucomicrobiota bacterium]